MSKVAHYLQEHLSGEVISSSEARRYFSTDGSIFQVPPSLIVYPRNENDVRKTARFSWQLAERGRQIPLTARGLGSDQTGAAIGSGMILVFTAHMNNILELNNKNGDVIAEPGLTLGKLQQTLYTHNRYIPVFPNSLEYETVGGAVANNRSGDASFKYGSIKNYIQSLRVVLANGEVIETRKLSKRELNKKLGLATFEGEIYRFIDTLIEEKHDEITKLERGTTINNAGLNLLEIKKKDSFNLTPLFVGSQGTLGIITEVILQSDKYDPKLTYLMASFDSMEHLQNSVLELREQSERPLSIELLDQGAIKQLKELNPNHLKDLLPNPSPTFVLIIQYESKDKKSIKKAEKILDKYVYNLDVSDQIEEIEKYTRIKDAISVLNLHNDGLVTPIPLLEGAVPPDRLREYIEGIYKLLSANSTKPAIWGHAGDANLFVRPKLNIGQVGDRQKSFRLMDEHAKLVLSLGGTISGAASDGRLKTPYLERMYGTDIYEVLIKLKKTLDPYNILNPGIKFGTSIDDLKSIIRSDFNLKHQYNYLPRS